MRLLFQAERMADKERNQGPHSFSIGDRVIMRGDYCGETGIITVIGTNMLGLPLCDVKLDSDPDGYQPCAYPHELELNLTPA